METLLEWCKYQNLKIVPNKETFFINEKLLLKPKYLINGRIFIEIPDDLEINEKYLEHRKIFSKSFGTIIIIPKSVLESIMDISKIDIQRKFNIKF